MGVVIWIVGQCSTDKLKPVVEAPPTRTIKYTVAEQWQIPAGGNGRALVISPANANEADLRVLGEQLKYETRDDRHAFVLVFSSARAAAMRGAAMRDELTGTREKLYDDHFVGVYNRNSNTGHHQMVVTPKGIRSDGIRVDY